MTHRSNQALASQDQAASQPQGDPPAHGRFLIGWATALAALGASIVLLGGGLWLARFSIAELLIGAALSERGAGAEFEVVALDFDHAVLNGLRFGAADDPDATITRIEAHWGWRGLVPDLRAVRVIEPRLRLRLDNRGRISAGALDQIEGRPSVRRPSIPALRLDIVDGQARIDAPFGALQASFSGDGVLGEDFSAVAVIAETTQQNGAYALEGGAGELTITSRDDQLAMRLYANAGRLRWNETNIERAGVRVQARAPLDLSRIVFEAAVRAAGVTAPRIEARDLIAVGGGDAETRDDALEPRAWQAQAGLTAAQLALADNDFMALRFNARAQGGDGRGRSDWSLAAQRFDGLALTSENPSATGAVTFDWQDAMTITGEARALLAQSRLDARAQQRIRDAFPNMPDAPFGPTFAAAEATLDRAADRFDLAVPLQLRSDQAGSFMLLAAPAEARASTGTVLQLAPLRQDMAAIQLDLRTLNLQGAVALNLQGGGAPHVAMLLDTMSWAPEAPFEADGTLSLANWRSAGAEIAAQDMRIGIRVNPAGDGVIDLGGPMRVSGPLGDGRVEDLIADLDIGVHWGAGWRVSTGRPCLPIQLRSLATAGLAFERGAFSLCAAQGALIAADARGRLSGGFAIERLGLQGRMAGPDAQPARLSARRVAGRFGGVEGDILLALSADAPTLRIDMEEDRALNLVLARITADARINESWRIDGTFEQGGLSDPTLPGAVSAIAGRWSAAPEDDAAVIRVSAAEALLQANRPASDAERPMFNPLRLVEVNAVLREGQLNADGAIVLEARARRLAQFTAQHALDAGAGGARISAPDIVFSETLQPYDLSELARGVVDNVSGPAAAEATLSWTREEMRSAARVRLNGVSLTSATIPVIENVSGEIVFDDLFQLTTPPGQEVRVGRLNPGVAVENGRVRFQLLPEGAISIEQAEFGFASGVLSMRPEIIKLGEDQVEILLSLRDVDASALIDTLNVPDLEATGRIEGAFPLRLTRRSAIITDGVLRAAPGGGRISYTGDAGEETTGVTRIAFDALRDFRYEVLSLTLNGDLNDEIVSDIEFSGENSGEPIDLSNMIDLAGVGNVSMTGVPFRFNVRVTAPFRSLANTAATIINPGSLLERERRNGPEVDPDGEPPG